MARQLFGLVDKLRFHHAGIDNGQHDLGLTVVKSETAYKQRIDHLTGPGFQEISGNNDRKITRRDIDGRRAGPKFVCGRAGGEREANSQKN